MLPESRAPWHHYLVTVISLLFYLLGTVDFTLTQLAPDFYARSFTQEQLRFFANLPDWIDIVWAIASVGGLFGTWLLWRRNRFSVLFLFLAFAAMAFLIVWLSIFTRPGLVGVLGFSGVYMLAATACVAFLIYTYARWERTKYYLI